jgi:hypothetical protein
MNPEQVIDSYPRRMPIRIGLWPRASPIYGDRHVHRTPDAPGMLIPTARNQAEPTGLGRP